MISSASSPERTGRPDLVAKPAGTGGRPPAVPSDQLSMERAAFLRAELTRQPEVRPEVVARGLALAQDPGYPDPAVIRAVAQQIITSADPAESEG